jgi:hypothetical protein
MKTLLKSGDQAPARISADKPITVTSGQHVLKSMDQPLSIKSGFTSIQKPKTPLT